MQLIHCSYCLFCSQMWAWRDNIWLTTATFLTFPCYMEPNGLSGQKCPEPLKWTSRHFPKKGTLNHSWGLFFWLPVFSRKVGSQTVNYHFFQPLVIVFLALMSPILLLPSSFPFCFEGWWWFFQDTNIACFPMHELMCTELRTGRCYHASGPWHLICGTFTVLTSSCSEAHSRKWPLPPLTLWPQGQASLGLLQAPWSTLYPAETIQSCLISASWTWCSSFN